MLRKAAGGAKHIGGGVLKTAAGAGYGVGAGVSHAAAPIVGPVAEGVVNQASWIHTEVTRRVNSAVSEVAGYIELRVERIVDKALDYMREKVKDGIKDPEMPKAVMSGVDLIVDYFWPNVRERVLDTVMENSHLRKHPDENDEELVSHTIDDQWTPWCPNPFKALRSRILYTFYPWNKTMWGQFRMPLFWFLTLLSLIPIFGISSIFYIIIFFLKDKRDEYSMVYFIIEFKSIVFFSGGFIALAIAAGQLYYCAVHCEPMCCDAWGPRQQFWETAIWGTLNLLLWAAFLCVPFSAQKGCHSIVARSPLQKKFDVDGDGVLNPDEYRAMRRFVKKYGLNSELVRDEDVDDGSRKFCCCVRHRGRGGRMRFWIMYDTFVFLLCGVPIVIFWFFSPWLFKEDWRLQATIFFLRVLYGLLSFPFVVFYLPLVPLLLTGSTPTGYTRNGKTVRYVKPTYTDEDDPEHEKEQLVQELDGLRAVTQALRGEDTTDESAPAQPSAPALRGSTYESTEDTDSEEET